MENESAVQSRTSVQPRYHVLALLILAGGLVSAQPIHYSVQLRPDFERKILRGIEDIEFREPDKAALSRQKNLTITGMPPGASEANGSIRLTSRRTRFEYEAKPGPGFRWLEDGGLVTMFDCGAWMVCDPSPAYRATLRLEIVTPSGMRAIGPGRLTRQYRDRDGEHYVYEVRHPAQSFLFSFAVAKLERVASGNFEILSVRAAQPAVLAKSAEVYRFFREKAGVGWPDRHYSQAFLSLGGIGQEAAGMALMSQAYLERLESRAPTDRTHESPVELMAHEMAHQWWAVLVGIRSWADFWLNEGITEFMTAAFVEHHHGRAAYEKKMATLQQEMEKLRAEGKDRPLHWERWNNATEALGPVPYRKGALFLDRLRNHVGDASFWRGIALYTRRHAGKLVDSRDFQQAIEEAAGRPLTSLFTEGVYR